MKLPLLAVLIVTGAMSVAWPCECIQDLPSDPLEGHSLIFLGKALGHRTQIINSRRVNEYSFRADQIITGNKGLKQVEVLSSIGDCGTEFRTGEKYLVFANQSGTGGFGTSVCSPNKEGVAAKAEAKSLVNRIGERQRFLKGIEHCELDHFKGVIPYVNGKMVKVGESVNGAKIISVDPGGILFEREGKTVRMPCKETYSS